MAMYAMVVSANSWWMTWGGGQWNMHKVGCQQELRVHTLQIRPSSWR